MQVKVHVFAGLKDYFNSRFELEFSEVANIDMILSRLGQMNPKSQGLLETVRFSVNSKFVHKDSQVSNGSDVFIYPPSSGG